MAFAAGEQETPFAVLTGGPRDPGPLSSSPCISGTRQLPALSVRTCLLRGTSQDSCESVTSQQFLPFS